MIEVIDIKKSFGEQEVLKGVSSTFHKGQTSMIIGSSGSGKTVFLKCLLGLFSPDSGDICYDNRLYKDMSLSEKRELRKEMGMVFQGGALFDSQSIEDNIKFPLKMFTDQSEEEMLDRVNFVLKRVKLENVNQKFPAELSGGMQKAGVWRNRQALVRSCIGRHQHGDPWSDIVAVVMERAPTDQVAVDHARLVDESTAADFQVKLAFGNSRHLATSNAVGIGGNFHTVADAGDRLVLVEEMLGDLDEVGVVADVFRRPTSGEEDARVFVRLHVAKGDVRLDGVALPFLGDRPAWLHLVQHHLLLPGGRRMVKVFQVVHINIHGICPLWIGRPSSGLGRYLATK